MYINCYIHIYDDLLILKQTRGKGDMARRPHLMVNMKHACQSQTSMEAPF